MSRAELTVRTGLNRSTVKALASELTELGLVRESFDPVGGRVGRHSSADDEVVVSSHAPSLPG